MDIPEGGKVIRYGVHIATATQLIPAGSWVSEDLLEIPSSPVLSKLKYRKPEDLKAEPLEGYSFMGYRNSDGTVGTRNVLGITTSVQCVSGMVNQLVRRLKEEELPNYPNVDDIVGLNHGYGCGVAINAPAAIIPIRQVKNLSPTPIWGVRS